MSFAQLKKKSRNNLEFLQKELEKTVSGKQVDERFWKPEVDASGNGYAVIRFLPAPDGETVPWAKVYSHAFQGPGGWYIENSLTTVGEKDPVGEVNRQHWNAGTEEGKEVARRQKRKLSYYSNILVVKDPKNPENEGKTFLYKYGKKIHDKILAAMQPEFQDEEPINVFDFWEGANFKLKIKTVAGFWNYDSSEFTAPAALSSDDEEMETIWKKAYSLEAFTAPDQFKTYDQLQQRLNAVLNTAPAVRQAQAEEEYEPTPVVERVDRVPSTPTSTPEEEDALSYFQKLAEE